MKPKSPRRSSTPGSGSLCPKLSFDWRCQNSAKLFSLPGFIGFPGLGADGLTRFHGPGSESSPMFTDLSARSCIDRRRRQKSPVSVYGRRTPWSNTSPNASAGSSSARQLNRMGAMACTGRSGKAKSPRRYRQIRGYSLPSAPVQSEKSSIQGSQRLRCSQQIAASDRPFRAGILRPACQDGQSSQVSANWRFLRILAQSPKSLLS